MILVDLRMDDKTEREKKKKFELGSREGVFVSRKRRRFHFKDPDVDE